MPSHPGVVTVESVKGRVPRMQHFTQSNDLIESPLFHVSPFVHCESSLEDSRPLPPLFYACLPATNNHIPAPKNLSPAPIPNVPTVPIASINALDTNAPKNSAITPANL